jgi:hypothetical protein
MARRSQGAGPALLALLTFASTGCDGDGGGPEPPPVDAAIDAAGGPPPVDASSGAGVDSGAPDAAATPEAGAAGDAAAAPRPFTIVVLPDTQFYARHYPMVFKAQTTWIAEKRQELNIAFVLHLGDIVDLNLPTEWMNASEAMALLDGKVPYLLNAGNHDLQHSERFGMINAFFPVSRFAGQPWFRGTFEPDGMHNSWGIFDAGGERWLVVSLEFGPRDGVLAWADQLLKQHAALPAIVVTHAYLYKDGTRYNRRLAKPQPHGVYDYPWLASFPGGANDGEEIWEKLVRHNGNVRFVLSGHDVFDAYTRHTSRHDDGSPVHEILSNYQYWYACPPGDCPIPGTRDQPMPAPYYGGQGWLRVMQFDPATRKLRVRTHSPFLQRDWEDAATADRNAFELVY